MSKKYIINNINEFMYKIYNIVAKITEIDNTHYLFDLGNNCKFVLNLEAFKTIADLNSFILSLSLRLNNVMNTA